METITASEPTEQVYPKYLTVPDYQPRPLVTCLCITGPSGRRQFLPRAITCYQSQTYPNKQLLILSDHDGEYISDLIPDVSDIIHARLPTPQPTIGDKRNRGVELCAGQIICHQDDDDYFVPTRVATQVAHLTSGYAKVTAYQDCYFINEHNIWIYHHAHPAIGIGSSLCYYRSWALTRPFPSLQIGEDNAFVQQAFASVRHPGPPDPLAPDPCTHRINGTCRERLYSGTSGLGMMVAWRHGANTSQQSMSDLNYLPYAPFPDHVPGFKGSVK